MKIAVSYKLILYLILLNLSNISFAAFTLGGYSQFPYSSQSDLFGGSNLLSLVPQLGVSKVIPVELPYLGSSLFIPEIGFIYYTNTESTYSKSSFYLLLDIGQTFSSGNIWRVGFGTFFSKVSGTGNAVILKNGAGTATFYMPSKSRININTTFDFGIEHAFDSNHAIKFMGYIYSAWSSVKRSLSLSVAWVYYPN